MIFLFTNIMHTDDNIDMTIQPGDDALSSEEYGCGILIRTYDWDSVSVAILWHSGRCIIL